MKSEFRLCGLIITYHPDLNELQSNIQNIIDYLDKIIIWVNTPNEDTAKYFTINKKYEDRMIFLGTGKNEGIAYAINQTFKWAVENGFTHLLTMDQDSIWHNFENYRNKIIEHKVDTSIGVFSPVIFEQFKRNFPEISFVNDAITSGSVYDLQLVNKIGLFREDFFIDAVDLEYCYWARRNGYKIALLGNCFLQQKYGNDSEHKFLNRNFHTPNYSAFRVYHIIRNHIFLWKEYPELSSFEKKRILNVYIFKRLLFVWMFEKDKCNKTIAVFKGIIHGFFGIGEQKRNY